jgi:hypothetical protein
VLLAAIGWLVREVHAHGFLPWEKVVLLLTWPASLPDWIVSAGDHMPLGPVIIGAVLILCLRRVWLAPSARPHQAAPASAEAQVAGAAP